jgi:hypothetical protein
MCAQGRSCLFKVLHSEFARCACPRSLRLQQLANDICMMARCAGHSNDR